MVFLAFGDILNIDKAIASYLFHVSNWDLNYFAFTTVIVSLWIPIIAILITIGLTSRKVAEYRINKIVEFHGRLHILHNYCLSLFSPLQNIPFDNEERLKFYRERYLEVLKRYNDLIDNDNVVLLFTNENKVIEAQYSLYLNLVKTAIINWHSQHIEEVKEFYKEYHETSSNYLNQSEIILTKLNQELKNLIDELER